jgi:hypothetical protein
MAGISTSISRKDLEFMAGDIGPELVAVMSPEEVLEGMGPEKQRKLLALFSPEERLAGMGIEDLLKALNAKDRRMLLNLLLKTQASTPTGQEESNGNSRTQ